MRNRLIREFKLLLSAIAVSSVLMSTLLVPAEGFASDLDTGSTLTSSAKTVSASEYDLDYQTAPMPNLSVTVSQTADLTSQGVLISWTGGEASTRPSTTGGENFLQIFQCWGEDPNNPGHPDRTTCQYGAFVGPGSTRDDYTQADQVDPQDSQFTVPGAGWSAPPYTSVPFNAATGEQVWSIRKANNGSLSRRADVDMHSNEFFSKATSNEITWAGSDANGSGSAKFEIHTAAQSPGLGCGSAQKVDSKFVGKSCWIVVLPRGLKDNKQAAILQSGLFWDAWKHHIAFKMDFRPIGVRCQIGVPERQVQGSELVGAAFSSWQPDLCGGDVKTAFVISNQFDGDALESASSQTSSPLAITTKALNEQTSDPLVYAPLTVGGLSITFAIDRKVSQSMVVPPDVIARDQTPFTSLKLNPRLLAKLLTASYVEALPPGADISHVDGNPRNLTKDPEFLALNADEGDWAYMDLSGPGLADLLVPNGRSLLAQQVWAYVMSDQSAADFMAGKPDEFGMKVNHWYSTGKNLNPSGYGFDAKTPAFPKSDPIEKPDTTSEGTTGSGAINLVTWRPFVSDFESGAAATLRGNAYELGAWNNMGTPPGFQKSVRDLPGRQRVLAVSTTAAAAQFQALQASLLNPAGNFVAPSTSNLIAAENVMSPSSNNKTVLELDYSSDRLKSAENAYPLTVAIYAAINPTQDDKSSRVAYANMIKFVAENGQELGTNPGQLPAGYAPLTAEMRKQALAAATAIANGTSPQDELQPTEELPYSTPTTLPVDPVLIEAGETPDDPDLPFTAASIPFVAALFVCALAIYGLLRKRMSRV